MSSVSALKARPQTAIFAPASGRPSFCLDLLDESPLLIVVDRLDRVDEQVLVADGAGDVLEGGHVLGEAASAVAAAGAEERGADAVVGADAFADVFDVRAVVLAEDRHLVHEGDAGGEHAVGGVLGQLGAFPAHGQEVSLRA